jgi:hypothetical protein
MLIDEIKRQPAALYGEAFSEESAQGQSSGLCVLYSDPNDFVT